jgi:hypothetical protein
MASFKDLATNDVPARTVYPTAGGGSLGARSTAYSPYTVGDAAGGSAAVLAPGMTATSAENAAGADNATAGLLGQPLSWWVFLIVLLYGVRFIGAKLGSGEEFKSLKVSVFNIVTVTLMAIIGIGFSKVLFNRFKVPGLTAFVNAV